MTVLLSFHDWGQYKGIETVFTLEELARDLRRQLFLRDFLPHLPHRLPGHAALAPLIGAPEAYILNRMRAALARHLPARRRSGRC